MSDTSYPFQTNIPFMYLPKAPVNFWFSGLSTEYKKGILARYWLMCEKTLKKGKHPY